MDFELSDEQRALRQMAREFADKEVKPVAAQHDRSGEFPTEVLRKAQRVGLVNASIPEQYGGAGLSAVDNCILHEEISAGCAGINTALSVNDLAARPVLLAGTEEQKQAFLGFLCSGELKIASYALTEPGAGSDVAGITSKALRHGDEYILNGTKRWITGGGHASWYVVFAYTDPTQPRRGMSALLVWRDTPGVSVTRKEDMMGQRASNTAEIVFEDVHVPAKNLLGREGDGFKIAMATFNHTRPGVGAAATGLARAAMEEAVKYAAERQAFGQPIGGFQAIQMLLADMAIDVAAARHLTLHASWLLDQGRDNQMEAAYAKAFAADMCMRVTTDALQVFGGAGYSREFPMEKFMRDAKIFQIYEGTSQIQRTIIARGLLLAAGQRL
ncbi:MAG: acyl-CoA dehydrogenase family protein [Chloroflexota bacterium]|nr:acyl-CoA dehydrogenase family protein [Chloroflexota bacterium]